MRKEYYISGYLLTAKNLGNKARDSIREFFHTKSSICLSNNLFSEPNLMNGENMVTFGLFLKSDKKICENVIKEFQAILITSSMFTSAKLFIEREDVETIKVICWLLKPTKIPHLGQTTGIDDWDIFDIEKK